MITNLGKAHGQRFQAGQVPRFVGSIALGVGTAPASLTDTALSFEVIRLPLISVNPDVVANKIVYRAVLPPGAISTIYEIGLYSAVTGELPGVSLPLPGEVADRWTNSTLVTTNARASARNLKVDYVANGTTTAELTSLNANLSDFAGVDIVSISFTATANLSSLRFRMGTDSSNYYEFVINSPAVGHNVFKAAISTATKVGNPTWSLITYFAVRPSATAGGSGSVFFDSIRFDKSPVANENVLVARKVLDAPVAVSSVIPTDVEYSMDVNIS